MDTDFENMTDKLGKVEVNISVEQEQTIEVERTITILK